MVNWCFPLVFGGRLTVQPDTAPCVFLFLLSWYYLQKCEESLIENFQDLLSSFLKLEFVQLTTNLLNLCKVMGDLVGRLQRQESITFRLTKHRGITLENQRTK